MFNIIKKLLNKEAKDYQPNPQGAYNGKDTKQNYNPMANVEQSEASREDKYPGANSIYTQRTTEGAIHDAKMANLNAMVGVDYDITNINRPDKNKEKAEGTKFAQKLANYK